MNYIRNSCQACNTHRVYVALALYPSNKLWFKGTIIQQYMPGTVILQGIDYLTPNEYYRNWLQNTKTKGGNVSLTY